MFSCHSDADSSFSQYFRCIVVCDLRAVTWWRRPCHARLKLGVFLDRLLTSLYPASSRAVPESCYFSVTSQSGQGKWQWQIKLNWLHLDVELKMWWGNRHDSGRPCCVTGTNNDWLSYCEPPVHYEMLSQYAEDHRFHVLLAVATVCCSLLRWLNCSISCRTTWTTEVCSAHFDRRGFILMIPAWYCSCDFGWSTWEGEMNVIKLFWFLVDRDHIPEAALWVGRSWVQLFAVTSFLK